MSAVLPSREKVLYSLAYVSERFNSLVMALEFPPAPDMVYMAAVDVVVVNSASDCLVGGCYYG